MGRFIPPQLYIWIYIWLDLWKRGFSGSKGPMLRASLAPRLWPSPPRTMGDCLHLPLSSTIIMIIILSRGLIQLARALIKTKVLASQSLRWTLLFTGGVVSKQPPPCPTSFDPKAWSTHPLLGQSLGYPAVPTKTASPLHFWAPGWPGAGLRPAPGENPCTGHVLTKSDRYTYRLIHPHNQEP